MHTESRCFTVRPTAAPREAYSVLVIDRTVGEAESVCARLREDGHWVEARGYGEDILGAIAELKPQAVVIRMRLGTAGRVARDTIERVFPHLHVITCNASTIERVCSKLPARWTDLYELSAPPPPRMIGFPRKLREAFEEELLPRYAHM
jgi:DNA-binding NtrC family response regulator